MKKSLLFLAIGATVVALVSFGGKTDKTAAVSSRMEPDSVFVMEAASSGMMEIELGKLVRQNSKHSGVRSLADMVIRDHTAANSELAAIARKKNFRMPDTLMAKHRRQVNKLLAEDAGDFDKRYVRMAVENHRDAIDEFEDASKKAADPDVRAFAAKQLPILKMHRDSAIALRKLVKDD